MDIETFFIQLGEFNIRKHREYNQLVNYIKKNINVICYEPEKSKYCILTIVFIFRNSNKFTKENCIEYLTYVEKLITNNYKLLTYECEELLRATFELLANLKMNGKSFFMQFKDFLTPLNFESIKAFILYFSYHANDYSEIDDILNQIIIKTDFTNRQENLDFNLYCFYKGNIFLVKKDFNLAAFSYLCSLVHLLNSRENCIDDAQIAMIKRLALLKQIVDSNVQELIVEVFGKFNKMKYYSEIKKYIEICVDNDDEKNFTVFYEDRKKDFASSKISGLAKIALNEFYLHKVKKQLKYYKLIKLTKLQKIVQIDFNKLINIIFYGIYNNKINVQYDEVEDILEIFNDGENINKQLNDVKNYYSLLTNAITNVYLIDKNKIDEINNFDNLSPEQKNKILMKQHKKRQDEELADDDEIEDLMDFN